tara:strand:+ start:5830 stop:6126 length:297 start_codon:yes stop_codon:yes gene_type:complete
MVIHRQDVLRTYIQEVMVGEIFPTYIPYDIDERIGKIVGCVYRFTCGWVEMHRNVLRSDQMQRIVVDSVANGDHGLYGKINNDGKEVLYVDKFCSQEW